MADFMKPPYIGVVILQSPLLPFLLPSVESANLNLASPACNLSP